MMDLYGPKLCLAHQIHSGFIQIPEFQSHQLFVKVSPSLLQQKVDGDVLLKALGAVVDAASIPNKERESLMSFVSRASMA